MIIFSVQSYTHRHRVKLVRRLVRKSGKSSIHQKSSTERSFRFLLDISNTLIETSWVWTLSVVTFVFIVTWLMFAGFWAIISIDNVEAWNGTSQSCLDGRYDCLFLVLNVVQIRSLQALKVSLVIYSLA